MKISKNQLLFWTILIFFPFGSFYSVEMENSLDKGKINTFVGIKFVKLYGSYYQMGLQYLFTKLQT